MFSYQLSEDVELRLLEPRHAEEYFAVCERNWERLYWLKEGYSLDDARVFLERDLRENFAKNNGFQAGIWVDGKLAGAIRFNDIRQNTKATSLGYWLDAAYEGRGIITRACRVFIEYAFRELKLNRIEIHCAVTNTRSRAVAEKLGFTQEGILRQSDNVREGLVDLVIYGLLAEEWKAREKKRP